MKTFFDEIIWTFLKVFCVCLLVGYIGASFYAGSFNLEIWEAEVRSGLTTGIIVVPILITYLYVLTNS